jgi:hypothetical protein
MVVLSQFCKQVKKMVPDSQFSNFAKWGGEHHFIKNIPSLLQVVICHCNPVNYKLISVLKLTIVKFYSTGAASVDF